MQFMNALADVKPLLGVLAGSANVGNSDLLNSPTMDLFLLNFLNKLAVSTEPLFKINYYHLFSATLWSKIDIII